MYPVTMSLIIEETDDIRAQRMSPLTTALRPSAVLERHDAGSLLYLLESTPTVASELADFDEFFDNELLADALGHRLLAFSGYDVDEDLDLEQQALCDYVLAVEDEHISPSDVAGVSRRRSSSRRSLPGRRAVHQEGFVAPRVAFAYEESDDDDDDDELEETLLGDEYFDWLGSQIMRRRAGLPHWVIDGVSTLEPSIEAEPEIEFDVSVDGMDIDYWPTGSRPRKTARMHDM